MRNTFLRNVRRFPWVTNVTMYGCLFAGGDFVHQWFSLKEEMDWRHTRNVAVVAFSFHGNFNFFWMRFLERVCPGNSAGMVLRKLFLDQTTAAPLATSVFYTGVSLLEGKDDILEDWREKFLNTYKTGLMFWPFMQFLNFALVPLYLRTTFTGCCAFVWATFLCFSRQSGDGTAAAALTWMFTPKQEATGPKEEQDLVPKVEATGAADEKPPPALVQEVQSSILVKPGSGEQATEQKEESTSYKQGTTVLTQKTTIPTNDTQTTNPKDTRAADLEASRIKGA